MAGVGIVVNPRAGGILRDPTLPRRLERILAGDGELVVADGMERISEAIEEFRSRAIDLLGVVGGDGSNLYALTVATRVFNLHLPPLVLLPGGSVNLVGRALGFRGTAEALLRRLLRHRGQGNLPARWVSTLRVNDYVAFVFGGALVGKFFQAFYRGRDRGLFDAGRMVARALAGATLNDAFARELFAPLPARIRVDGCEISEREYTLLVASTIESHFGIKVTYRASRQPGRFQFVASGGSNRELALQFPRALLGLPLSGRNHLDEIASSVDIEHREPASYIIDGDLYEGERIEIRSGPPVQVVSP